MPTPVSPHENTVKPIQKMITLKYEGPTEFIGPVRQHNTLLFRLETQSPIPVGTTFRLVLGWFRSLLDNNPQKGQQWRHFAVEVQGGGAAVVVRQPPGDFYGMGTSETEIAGHFCVGSAEVAETIAGGSTLTLGIEGMLSHQAPLDARLLVQVAGPGREAFETIGDPVELINLPGPVVGLEARLKSIPDAAGRFPLHVHGVDSTWNPAVPHVDLGALEVEVIGPGELVGSALQVTGDGPVRVRVRDPERGYESLTNPVRRDLPGGRRVSFGEIHWHSRHCDGDRPLSWGYDYARDVLGLDFAGVTDHTPIPVWQQTLEINALFNEPGRFVTLPSWEWSTPTGHANIYLRNPKTAAGPEHALTADHPCNAEWPGDALLVPHHTNIVSYELKADGSHFWSEYNWHLPNERVRLVELLQTRGNFEADQLDGDWGIVTSGIGASIQDALAMGYRIGFIGGTDNHTAFPTRDSKMGGNYKGMACVLAEEHSSEGIWDAMNARRTYATSGKPVLAHWTVNGNEMGSEAKLADGNVHFSATLHGTSPIERIEVISNGRVVWRAHPDAFDVTLVDQALPAPEGASAYYYLRLRQHDGHGAWLSPVWLDRA